MNIQNAFRSVVNAGLLAVTLVAQAADIDIYSGLTGPGALPNVLVILDNAANFSSSASGAGTCTLTNTETNITATNSLSGTVGGIEQCAFYNVIKNLPTNADGSARVNIGFMVYNANNITDYQGNNCQSSNGGCLVYPLKPMSGDDRARMLNWITTWKTSNSGPGSYWIKAPGAATAATMQEAWAYYSGNTGLSGRNYSAIQPPSGCQKNFVIFIGNSFSSSGSPGDGGSASPAAALTAAYGSTPLPTPTPILGSLNTSCGAYTFPSGANHEGGGFYADEWARFMRNTDIFSASTGTQNITTYTIGVIGPSCQASYAALLTSTANYGGGKYFATSDSSSVVQALLNILNEVQAVNSVFAAATLPVSVNAQGTYLNQVYMGMFRPDANASPRWVGNLKQYQFQFDPNQNLYLADATGQPAISSGGTGFISPGAASFWSCTNSTHSGTLVGPGSPYTPYSSLPTCAADPATGFWVNNLEYVANSVGRAYDLEDGEVVEKGGVSQQLRLSLLNTNYSTTPSSPRNLYTWCPGDPNNLNGNCDPNLTHSANSFSTSNTAITAAMLGTGLNVTITTITRSGTTATATTAGAHGLTVGSTVTVAGANPADYNGLVTITSVPNSNQFTYTVPEYPPTPATTVTSGGIGGYVAAFPSGSVYNLSSLSRVAAGTSANATVTGVTTLMNGFSTGSSVTISGASPANYNLTQTVNVSSSFQFSYPVAVNPTPAPVGSYVISLANAATVSIASVSCNNATKIVTLNTSTAHNLRTGDQITISGDTQSKSLNGNFTNVTVNSATQITYAPGSCPGTAPAAGTTVRGGPASPLPITSLTRNEIAVGTATATVQISSSNQFANGDLVNITLASGTQPANETGYLVSSVPISCSSNPCGTTFSLTIGTTPGVQPSGTMTAMGAAPGQTVTSLTRSGTTATATITGTAVADGTLTAIQTAPGTTLAAHEGAYLGTWNITCVGASPCNTFTYGPLTLSPASPATGSMTASNPGANPDRTLLINWVRGEDNYGDEQSLCPPGTATGTGNCPSTRVTVRPSVHGDTLHSRPITISYGSDIGVVVFYGANDGIYRAVNGNQTQSIGSTKPGGELWGFVAPDFYNKFNRQRTNVPALLLPSTPPGINPPPQPKDYFFDGATGVYLARDASNNITQAIIYVNARRGGRFVYALDVTDPLVPKVLWRISNSTPGFEELGQAWSMPQPAKVAGYSNPVLFLGGGYDDTNEDVEPPTPDTAGRGIYAVDAITGALVWKAMPRVNNAWTDLYWYRSGTHSPSTCTGTVTQAECLVDAMTYSFAADLALVDRDNNGTVDRLYGIDTGGNIWRVDLEPTAGSTPNLWQVTQLAQLGCDFGYSCNFSGSGTPLPATKPVSPWTTNPPKAVYAPYPATYPGTPRKFFYSLELITAPYGFNYDALFVGSGDREHPLYINQSYDVINRMYMIKDYNTGMDSSTQGFAITELTLDDCTGTAANPNTCSKETTGADSPMPYCKLTQAQQRDGYYITLNPGEKVVNAPLAVVGSVFFGTNQPATLTTNSCATNLGIARGYALSPFCGTYKSLIYDGGGMPPSAVTGIVRVGDKDAMMCIGCIPTDDSGTQCKSAECGSRLKPKIPAVRTRSYWYLEGK